MKEQQAGLVVGWELLRRGVGELCRSDYFETLEECALLPGCLPVGLGAGCTVQKCIIDKNARIGPNVQIVNKDGIQVLPLPWRCSPFCSRTLPSGAGVLRRSLLTCGHLRRQCGADNALGVAAVSGRRA